MAQTIDSATLEPQPEAPPRPPALAPLEFARWIWRQLTSMRTALILLFLLALAAIPGSLFPQRGVNPILVAQYKDNNPRISPWLERLGMFDVYASTWFAAIYLLLFVSLIGCLLPRTLQHLRMMRKPPPPAPRNLLRLPVARSFETTDDAGAVLSSAEEALRRGRFRVVTGDGWVAAEKGYLRETGNLVFHFSLVVLLVGMAVGSLFGVKGIALVVEGEGFANTVTQYDAITPGALADVSDLAPFSFRLDDFRATYETSAVARGSPRTFEADLSVRPAPTSAPEPVTVRVNDPLRVEGYKAFLIGHGYAPVFTVTDGRGRVVFDQAVPCAPQDLNFTSECVVKVPDSRPDQLSFAGFFFPTVVEGGGPVSYFPGAENPAVYLNGFTGDLGLDDGVPRSVYTLDTDGLVPISTDASSGRPTVVVLRPGDTFELPGGLGSIAFTGLQEWATFSVARDPGKETALLGSVAAIAGLMVSLLVRRRRVWVRATPSGGPDGTTTVEVAGLAKTEAGGVEAEVEALVRVLGREVDP